ncbi:MAG: UbiX family flavin prenyltransferase [Thermoleophilia bacterium]|jgi:4-hydroxy-3-polyprenylbenzoate decarboxylase|nr:UbiX family flavin prenyltransferase [Thermoleophilia bacterium]
MERTLHHVFLGVTGASGAAYALRLAQALTADGLRLSLSLTDAGILVVAHELELAGGGRQEVTRRFVELVGADVAVHEPGDLAAPPSSGSSGPDAVVVCPCSMSSAAHIALGTSRHLVHRAADVALKERRPLVLVPRETPLSSIHLRRLLEASEAGAAIVPAMPAFYHRPATLQEAVDHIVGKVLTTLGLEQTLFPPWDGG